MKKVTSIRWKMVRMILLYWALPFILLIMLLGRYISRKEETEGLAHLAEQLRMNNQICMERVDNAVRDSRQATYDRALYNYYSAYRKGEASYSTIYNNGQNYLAKTYGKRQEISGTVFMMLEDPEHLHMTNYNSSAGGSYRLLEIFWEEDCPGILELAGSLETSIGMFEQDGRLYIARNLVDGSYKPWGVLVHCLNKEYCFEPLLAFFEGVSAWITLDGKDVVKQGDEVIWEGAAELEPAKEAGYQKKDGSAYIYQLVRGSDFEMRTIMAGRLNQMFSPLYSYRYLVLYSLLFLIPMILLFLWLAKRYLTHPLQIMVDQAHEIEAGNLGVQLVENTKSREFEYLRESFNHMSSTLKYQFDHIYEEELALRDARIMALQSNINPHFMNNTLEIINWEARLGNNEGVSKMIEALSVLMDAAMDRHKKPEVPLSEEMGYVNAYLYITSERLGQRLTIVKELAEETLSCMVPRLIMQPIIENAVNHGIVPRGQGTVEIRSRIEGEQLILEITNDGDMTEDDREKIKDLLSPDYDAGNESSLNLGIANVNQRLRILYGDACGLTIAQEGDKVVSRMRIALQDQAIQESRQGDPVDAERFAKSVKSDKIIQ